MGNGTATPLNQVFVTFDGEVLFTVDNDVPHDYQHYTYTRVVSTANPVLEFKWFNASGSYFFIDDVSVCRNTGAYGACCAVADGSCTFSTNGQAGCPSGTTYQSDGTSCTPTNPCPVPGSVCCRGSTCSTTVAQADCVGSGSAGAAFVLGTSGCNAGASNTSPCCYADFNKINGLSVQDIFDYLSAWFGASPFANYAGDGNAGALAVQDIFDFLAAWFAGGC
jgi:hypothetical protein